MAHWHHHHEHYLHVLEPHEIHCPLCEGRGHIHLKEKFGDEEREVERECPACHRHGHVPRFPELDRCHECHGHGFHHKDPHRECHHCHGKGYLADYHEANHVIKKAIQHGEEDHLRYVVDRIIHVREHCHFVAKHHSEHELNEWLKDAEDVLYEYELERRAHNAIADLKDAMAQGNALRIDQLVGALSEIGHETNNNHVFRETEEWRNDGNRVLSELEQSWTAVQGDLQADCSSLIRSRIDEAHPFLNVDYKVDQELKSFVNSFRNALDEADSLLSARFLPHREPFRTAELSENYDVGASRFRELSWKVEEVDAQHVLRETSEYALEAKTDDDRERTRNHLSDAIGRMRSILDQAPDSEAGRIIRDGGSRAFDQASYLYGELVRLYEDDMRQREDRRPEWIPDDSSKHCRMCDSRFVFLWRHRHHCRQCGNLICDDCSKGRKHVPELKYFEDVRVCDECINAVLDFEPINFPEELFDWVPSANPV